MSWRWHSFLKGELQIQAKFHGIDKLILKCLWKNKRSRLHKTLLKKSEVETCPNMKTYSFTKLEQIRQCDTGAEINKVTAGLEDKASTWTHTYMGL